MTQLDELLREGGDRVPVNDAIERHALDRARNALRVAAAGEQEVVSRRWPTFRMGRFVAIAGLAATIAVILAFLPGGTGSDVSRLGPPPASAQAWLEQAARRISRQPWRPLAPGEYYYSREVGTSFGRNGKVTRRPMEVQQAWYGANGFARLVQTGPSTLFEGGDVLIFHATHQQLEAERARQQREAHLHILAYSQKFRWVDLDYQQLIRLPTDPALLLRYIEQNAIGGGRRFSDIFSYAEALLGGGGNGGAPLPPKVSAAMYRVVARLPHMRLIGPTRDPLGRPGIAIGLFFKHQPGRIELILNPTTGVLLGEEMISLSRKEGARPGTVIGWSAIEDQRIVRSDHQGRPSLNRP